MVRIAVWCDIDIGSMIGYTAAVGEDSQDHNWAYLARNVGLNWAVEGTRLQRFGKGNGAGLS